MKRASGLAATYITQVSDSLYYSLGIDSRKIGLILGRGEVWWGRGDTGEDISP